ncbi:hypothetical protein MN608_00731 [Microdochium nivale]|nr:hypothetical protein MN608_00731 [Microdochium nivale]
MADGPHLGLVLSATLIAPDSHSWKRAICPTCLTEASLLDMHALQRPPPSLMHGLYHLPSNSLRTMFAVVAVAIVRPGFKIRPAETITWNIPAGHPIACRQATM